jgi:hypothetical protein
MVKGKKINAQDLYEDPKKAERMNQSHLVGGKSQFSFNIMSDPTLVLPLQWR